MNSFKVYLALQGTPFELTNGASANAAYIKRSPDLFVSLSDVLILNPLESISNLYTKSMAN